MKTKRVFFLCCLSTMMLFTSCGSLKKQISVETGCPTKEIKLIAKHKSGWPKFNATYAYDVCGKRIVYKKVGSVYLKAAKQMEL